MDRQLTSSEKTKGVYKKYLYIIGSILLLLALWTLFKKVITKTGNINDFHIVTVDKGPVRSTLTATGLVVPASERIINSPVTTEVQSVLMQPGANVKKGDLILKLDQEYTALEYEKLKDELALRKNNISKLKLEYDKNLKDLDYDNKIKGLEVSELQAQLADQTRLLKIGAATQEEVEAVDLQLKIAQSQQQTLENELAYRNAVNGTDKQNLELEYNIQAKRLKELQRKLSETNVTSPTNGVITWINEDIGKTVTVGEPLVRLANLNRFKIEGTTSDRNSKDLEVGMPVEVRIDKERLQGTISRILPEIIDNTLRFDVELDEDAHTALRPNLRTELYIVKAQKEDVLRAKRGTAIKGTKSQYFYKVENGVATKVRVDKGLLSSDFFEIEAGLNEGDQIIISDVDDYEHMPSFEIKN